MNITKYKYSLIWLILGYVELVNHGDMVPTEFESVTVRLEGECSIQLSYGTVVGALIRHQLKKVL